jgi:flagellar hook-basal body complex protein FliE
MTASSIGKGTIVITGGIDSSKIEAMLAQLKATAATAQGLDNPIQTATAPKTGFADALKSSLDHVNQVQQQAQQLGQSFATGNDKVSLSDTMIAMQKANISLQETIQVRDRLVAAYTSIMNMQV